MKTCILYNAIKRFVHCLFKVRAFKKKFLNDELGFQHQQTFAGQTFMCSYEVQWTRVYF